MSPQPVGRTSRIQIEVLPPHWLNPTWSGRQIAPSTVRSIGSVGARQNASAQGFPLTGFKQIRDQTLALSQGVHGVRETYNYTFTGNVTDTFDEVALTNADQTVVYLLVLHCTTSCYSNDQTEINDVMSSFTIRSS